MMISIKGEIDCFEGREFLLGPAGGGAGKPGYVAGQETIAGLRAGGFLSAYEPLFQVTDKFWMAESGGRSGIFLKLLALGRVQAENSLDLVFSRQGFSLAWITLSDKAAANIRTDSSGPLIEKISGAALKLSLVRSFVVPDDSRMLRSLFVHLALVSGFDLIITTGGTGLGPRDITPDVTLDLIEKRLPGFEQAMLARSLDQTPHAVISRAAAGTLGQSIIINLPGSPGGVRDNLEAVLPAADHALKKLQGDPSDCAAEV